MLISEKYIPQQGDKFNAIVKNTGGKIAIGCPCVCTDITNAYILAADSADMSRQFSFQDFKFAKIEKNKRHSVATIKKSKSKHERRK